MSKISKQNALEAYPEDYAYIKCDNEDTNYTEIDDEGIKWLKVDTNKEFRTVYAKGYDQAMQDFLEKAEKILTERMYFSDDEAKQFKNYIQNEEV